ncbi:MAG: hypothetical protein EOR30_32010 [Mesorhizobium sp.]|uniref:hypothetical protein n=1 Tax=Mesorhizobium sp. TaxID=1871066 RepID=UPI000FE7312E|nr:hypothetical protein [Mesorhizobium sp.]RWI33315.1 MAG: hypothetical protein EOR14_33260 [Mesorhizobium sp.]RWI37055.1 MAG: hypothetical protein EOR14_25935 [Mesorhizobium sp.]RWI62641.1 MAG: hypothetical protein EOR17_32165 [Mesorhizobium sp.]RWI81464.1 MAG: hypothetical protein EOR20_32580 [Mesorhizobium sp.]RWJ42377.1 MAG: hypothetical protein EOR30_32010 [Mesorhizobium sp.]
MLGGYVVEPDGSTRDFAGQTIFFSFNRFRDEICKTGHCFVCGAAPSKWFNNEHVFPNWMLRLCGIHGETLTLPNGQRVKYGTYKIPCCQGCNTKLAEIFETPVSKVIQGGYDGLIAYIKAGGYEQIAAWLALIFLKSHLRDFQNRVSLDQRQDLGVIGDDYDLNELHHIHAVARANTAGVDIDDKVFGTLVVLQVAPDAKPIAFDYCDNLAGRSMLLQIQDIALIYVLDDCGATAGMLSEQLKTLPDPISQIQLREVYARHLAANFHIKERPVFRTEFSGPDGRPRISATLPNLELLDYQPSVFGGLLAGVLEDFADMFTVDGESGAGALRIISTGRVSFLFDENGDVRSS